MIAYDAVESVPVDVVPPWMKSVLLASTAVCPRVPTGGGAGVVLGSDAAWSTQVKSITTVKRMDLNAKDGDRVGVIIGMIICTAVMEVGRRGIFHDESR
jgi:hypothetical protein